MKMIKLLLILLIGTTNAVEMQNSNLDCSLQTLLNKSNKIKTYLILLKKNKYSFWKGLNIETTIGYGGRKQYNPIAPPLKEHSPEISITLKQNLNFITQSQANSYSNKGDSYELMQKIETVMEEYLSDLIKLMLTQQLYTIALDYSKKRTIDLNENAFDSTKHEKAQITSDQEELRLEIDSLEMIIQTIKEKLEILYSISQEQNVLFDVEALENLQKNPQHSSGLEESFYKYKAAAKKNQLQALNFCSVYLKLNYTPWSINSHYSAEGAITLDFSPKNLVELYENTTSENAMHVSYIAHLKEHEYIVKCESKKLQLEKAKLNGAIVNMNSAQIIFESTIAEHERGQKEYNKITQARQNYYRAIKNYYEKYENYYVALIKYLKLTGKLRQLFVENCESLNAGALYES